MTTSNRLWYEPKLVTSNSKPRLQSLTVPAGCGGSAPVSPERCMRCFANISNVWHVRQVCDACLEWEIAYLQRANKGVAA